MMNPAAAGDGGGDAAAWTATESYGDEEVPRTVNGTGHTGPSEFCATRI